VQAAAMACTACASGARGAVAFDRRFRGEQVIAAAIRAMRSGTLPMAVFVHAGNPGMLRPSPDHADFAAAADALRSRIGDELGWRVAVPEHLSQVSL